MKRALILLALLVWAVLALFPLLSQFGSAPMPRVPQNTDFFVTHWPIVRYVHDMISQYGTIPLWNSMILSGQPFAADPLSGYGYPPNWLTFWLPEPGMFTLLFLIHLVWTGWGMLKLLRAEGAGELPALLAAWIWMATPRLVGYIGSGQVSMVFALAWTPWLLLAFRKAARQPGPRQVALAAACLAITFLADVRWGLLGGLFAAAYAVSQFNFRRANWRQVIPLGLAGMSLFLLMTAGLTLPMAEFVGLSRRVGMTMGDAGGFSLEPAMLLGLLIPPYGMLHELVVYLGWAPLLLGVFGAARRKFFWLAAAGVAAIYALGLNGFLFPLLARLPGFSWLRVPARAWFLVALCAAALAGWGADGFLGALSKARPGPRWLALAFAGIAALTCANLLWYDASQLSASPLPTSEVNAWLEAQPGPFRVYSPDGSLGMPNRLQQANGVNPLHLAGYARFLGAAAGMPASGYSVSLPDVYIDVATPAELVRAAAWPDPEKLGRLNVKYLVSGFPLQSAGLNLVKTIGKTRIYENLLVQPRAWLAGADVEIRDWSPDRVVLVSEGNAGMLTLSEIAYPGWQVSVDDHPAEIQTVDGLLRGVILEAGRHEVIFEFRPFRVYVGAALAVLGWAACLGMILH